MLELQTQKPPRRTTSQVLGVLALTFLVTGCGNGKNGAPGAAAPAAPTPAVNITNGPGAPATTATTRSASNTTSTSSTGATTGTTPIGTTITCCFGPNGWSCSRTSGTTTIFGPPSAAVQSALPKNPTTGTCIQCVYGPNGWTCKAIANGYLDATGYHAGTAGPSPTLTNKDSTSRGTGPVSTAANPSGNLVDKPKTTVSK